MGYTNTVQYHQLLLLVVVHLLGVAVFVVARPATFYDDFSVTWEESHIRQIQGGTAIQLVLDQSSGISVYVYTNTH